MILCFILIAISLNCSNYTSSKVTVRGLKTWKAAREELIVLGIISARDEVVHNDFGDLWE